MKSIKKDFIKDFVIERIEGNRHLFSRREIRLLRKNAITVKKIYILALKDCNDINRKQ